MNYDVSLAQVARPNRRTGRRRTTVRPAKIFDSRAERYFSARTTNLSDDGAMLIINRSMPIARGDAFEIGILETQPGDTSSASASGKAGGPEDPSDTVGCFSDEGVLKRRQAFRPALVVRVMPIDAHTQAVAVRFNDAQSQPITSDATPGVEVNVLDPFGTATKPRTGSRRPAAAA